MDDHPDNPATGSTRGPLAAATPGSRRRWAGLLVPVLATAGTAAALGPRLLAKVHGNDGRDGAKQPPVALEFTPAELTRPVAVAMPLVVSFSGPLVALSTVVVRARAAGKLNPPESR